jgi:peptide deformylase
MSILKVARMGHPVLRARASAVSPAEIASPRMQQLIDDMFETMQEYAGIGLAAPQVHAGIRLFVAGLREAPVGDEMPAGEEMPYVVLINPELKPAAPEVEEGWEGCLSIPDLRGRVPRAVSVDVAALDRQGRRIRFRASGLAARVIQHETDHLDGVLFVDRMRTFESLTFMDEYRRYVVEPDDDEAEP